VIKEKDEGHKEALARILAAITEEAGNEQTARRTLRERVEADNRAIVDHAVRTSEGAKPKPVVNLPIAIFLFSLVGPVSLLAGRPG